MINGQLILEEEYDENYQPTEQEIFEYAQSIGIDPIREKDLLFIAREGIVAPLPADWKPCQDASGDIYYFNFQTGDSVWDHPCDDYYRNMVLEEKRRRTAMGTSSKKENKRKDKKDGGKKNKTLEAPIKQKSLSPGLAPLKGEGSLAPLRDPSPGRSLGSSLGASSTGGTLGGTPLGTGPLGGGSLGRGSLGGSLGGGSLGGSLGKGSLGAGSMGGLGTGGRLSNVERYMDPFQQPPLGTIKDASGVSLVKLVFQSRYTYIVSTLQMFHIFEYKLRTV